MMDVVLRDVLEDDLPILFEHQQDPAANQMAAFTPRDQPSFTAHWTKILADGSVAKQTILFRGQVAGNIVAFDASGKREIGYWIGREYWGKGIATEALRQFLRHETERPLIAVVAKHNTASLRVLEKCGFSIEGPTRGSPGARGPVVEELILELSAKIQT
jgi:RimJ/RimL family protein N-acetyltransferase